MLFVLSVCLLPWHCLGYPVYNGLSPGPDPPAQDPPAHMASSPGTKVTGLEATGASEGTFGPAAEGKKRRMFGIPPRDPATNLGSLLAGLWNDPGEDYLTRSPGRIQTTVEGPPTSTSTPSTTTSTTSASIPSTTTRSLSTTTTSPSTTTASSTSATTTSPSTTTASTSSASASTSSATIPSSSATFDATNQGTASVGTDKKSTATPKTTVQVTGPTVTASSTLRTVEATSLESTSTLSASTTDPAPTKDIRTTQEETVIAKTATQSPTYATSTPPEKLTPGGNDILPDGGNKVAGDICMVADIVFVVDSSGSVGAHNWPLVLSFLKSFAADFDIGPLAVQMAVVIFGNRANVQFHLNSFSRREDVLKAIDDVPWKDQKTNTSGGLVVMCNEMFTVAHGDRPNVPNIAVVMTDGESTVDKNMTIPNADKARRDKDVKIFVIGVGDQINKAELIGIADSEDMVLRVDDFSGLSMIKDQLIGRTCRQTTGVAATTTVTTPTSTTTTPTTTPTPTPTITTTTQPRTLLTTTSRPYNAGADETCMVADIVFVVDSSGSVGAHNWPLVLSFLQSFADDFNIAPNAMQIGVVIFGNRASIQFHMNTYNNSEAVKTAISRIPYKDQKTNTSGGIVVMCEEMFTRENGDRDDAPNIAIVMTDGESTVDKNMTIPTADAARVKKAISLFAIGIGDQINQDELNGIADNNDQVFNVENFQGLSMVQDRVINSTCRTLAACHEENDVIFMLDASASVRDTSFALMKQFITNVSMSINVMPERARVGAMTFSTEARVAFHLNSHDMLAGVEKDIQGISQSRGRSNVGKAFKAVREMFQAENGDRATKRNIAVLLTNGASDDYEAAIEEALHAHRAGIEVVVIHVGTVTNPYELALVTTDPDDANAFLINSFEDLPELLKPIKKVLCNDVNECVQFECLNGGTCKNEINRAYCICPDGYAGKHCEQECREYADVVIALDTSSSVQQQNYLRLLQFTKELVDHLPIRSDRTRLGLESFASEPRLRFHLNAATSKAETWAAVDHGYSGGSTDTAAALSMMRELMFQADHGDRGNKQNFGLLITDGKSKDREGTFSEASLTRESGVYMLATGVNVRDMYWERELFGIASDPNYRSVFNMSDFKAFTDPTVTSQIFTSMVDIFCSNARPCQSSPCQHGGTCTDLPLGDYHCRCPPGHSGTRCEQACIGSLDLVFVLDASGSVRESRYQMVKDWVIGVISHMQLGEEDHEARVGFVIFSDTPQVVFPLGRYRLAEDVQHAIRSAKYMRGRTNIADAIIMARELFMDGDRYDANDPNRFPNVMVLITDGEANEKEKMTLFEAQITRLQGIRIIVAVPEADPSNSVFAGMASNPDHLNLIAVPKYQQIGSMMDTVVKTVCNDKNECESNPCMNGATCVDDYGFYRCQCMEKYTGFHCERTCMSSLDVVLVIDVSGSTEDACYIIIELSKLLIAGLNYAGGRSRVGLMTFSNTPHILFHLNNYTSREEVLNAFNFVKESGNTYTALAIRSAQVDMFTAARGDRQGNSNVMIIISDGWSTMYADKDQQQSEYAIAAGIRIIGVGVEEGSNMEQIQTISSTPTAQNAFHILGKDHLQSVANEILDELCQ